MQYVEIELSKEFLPPGRCWRLLEEAQFIDCRKYEQSKNVRIKVFSVNVAVLIDEVGNLTVEEVNSHTFQYI